MPAIPGTEGVEPKEEEATKQGETANATSEPQQEVQVQVQEAAALPIPNDEQQSYALLSVTDLPPPLRRGKWTAEESSYANRLIHEFRCGSLALPNNITLREFLSKLLRCDPMRITKKFEGDNSLRKVVYKRMADDGVAHVIRGEIRVLESAFLERLEHTRSTSSQAVADKALLDAFRHSEASDLIELFCLNLKSEAANNAAASASSDAGYVHARGGASYKRQNEYTVDNGAVVQSVPSFQRDLLMHLSRMQMLIQQQQLVLSAEDHSSALPPLKKFKTDQEANETASSADQAYNMAVSNLLSIQRMIMDNKHKLYDIEFNLAESVELNSEEPTTTTLHHAHDDTERKNQVMALIRQEIEDLEKQKVEMEREIELKYKSVGNDDDQQQQQQQQQDVVDETVHHDAEMKVEFD